MRSRSIAASWRGAPRSPSASAKRRGRSSPAAPPPTSAPAESRASRWVAAGDVNGFLGLALDNVTNLVILSSLLIGVFGFPADLVLGRMVPGTALGVLVGDLAYTWLALRLMRRSGRADVTAMPFGIDTPTLFAMVFGVLGPVKVATGDAMLAWKVGMVATLAIGLVKTALAFAGDWTRRVVPRAALLGSIAGVANTESAAAAGDEYRARDILLTEAVATLVAGLCGGVVQNTPYIGHPAYKAMGARAGYTLATGLVIGVGAMVGVLSILVTLLPEAAVAPILVFIGLAITAQAFLASPPRHGPAVAITFVPVAAAVVLIQLGAVLAALGKSPAHLRGDAALTYRTLLVLGNGFILTALLWGWARVTM